MQLIYFRFLDLCLKHLGQFGYSFLVAQLQRNNQIVCHLPGQFLCRVSLSPEALQATLVCLLKTASDRDALPAEVMDRLIGKVA